MSRLLQADLELLSGKGPVPWEALQRARLLVTGGTGFVGAWMAATLLDADDRLGLGVELVLLTRSPRAVAGKLPWLAADRRVTLVAGDVRECAWPAGPFTHVVAGAASADAATNERDPAVAYRTIAEGSRRTLDAAMRWGSPRTVLLSSGAVYGPLMSGRPAAEDMATPKDAEASEPTYHAGKRAAEATALAACADGLPVTLARLFAFVGPYLPLDRHFAVGNFVGDALRGGPVTVRGDGTPVRSYLYGCDMALWLWTIILRGRSGEAYNVGSERAVSVSEVARIAAATVMPPVNVDIRGRVGRSGAAAPSGGGGSWYVPSTAKAREELGLQEWTSLEQGVVRMVDWYRERVSR